MVRSEHGSFRLPSREERAIVIRLLDVEFPGAEELRVQFGLMLVRRIDDDGSLEFKVDPGAPSAQVERRVPVEAQMSDRDCVTINLLLHVVDGVAKELEIFRDDGASIQRDILASDMEPWSSV